MTSRLLGLLLLVAFIPLVRAEDPPKKPAPAPAKPASAPVRSAPPAAVQQRQSAGIQHATANVNRILPATPQYRTTTTTPTAAATAYTNSGRQYSYVSKKAAAPPSPVNKMNPTGDRYVQAGIDRNKAAYNSRQAQIQAANQKAAAQKAAAAHPKRQLWDKPPGQ